MQGLSVKSQTQFAHRLYGQTLIIMTAKNPRGFPAERTDRNGAMRRNDSSAAKAQVCTPAPHKDTPTPEEDTPVPEKDTPVPQKDTPIPEKDTPVPHKDTWAAPVER
jgi:hypothetical protein